MDLKRFLRGNKLTRPRAPLDHFVLAKLEANRARMEAQFAVHTARFPMATAAFTPVTFKAMPAPVVCPRVRVNIPKLPMVKMPPPVPEIHIEMAGTGPV